MARNLSWIDNERLASLLDVVSPAAPGDADGDAAGDGDFDSGLFAAAQAPSPAAQAPSPAPVRAEAIKPPRAPARSRPAPTPAAVPAAPTAAPFQADSDADLWERLNTFVDWVLPATNSRGAIVTDAHGLVVVERGADEVEAAMSTSIDLMLNHVSDVLQHGHTDNTSYDGYDGYVALQRDGLHLITLWTPSAQGRFFGVLISETAPHPASLVLAGQGLRTLFAN